MDKRPNRSLQEILLALAVVLVLVFAVGLLAACGDDNGLPGISGGADEQQTGDRDDGDEADEADARDNDDEADEPEDRDDADDEDVDIDVDDDGQTITITGDDGEATIQAGGDVDLPDDFPAGLIPDDADVVEVISYDEGGTTSYIVAVESSEEPGDMYDELLEGLDDEGYSVVNKMLMEGGSDESAIVIVATKGSETVNITGGGEEGEGFTYMIQYQSAE